MFLEDHILPDHRTTRLRVPCLTIPLCIMRHPQRILLTEPPMTLGTMLEGITRGWDRPIPSRSRLPMRARSHPALYCPP